MRVTRALWASLGAGMSIVLTGALILAAVSTFVAFQGWPGAAASQASTPAAMLADSATLIAPRSVSASTPIVVPDAPRERNDAASRPSSGTSAGLARTVIAGTTDGGALVGSSGAVGASGHIVGFGPTDEPPVPEPKLTDGVRDAGAALGTGATQSVDNIGDVVAPASPQLDQTVDAVGAAVGDTVQGVTNTVADVLDDLLAPR